MSPRYALVVTPVDPGFSPDQLRRARIAVAALFLVNGSLLANVLPRLPSIKEALALSNAELGAAIAAGPVGGLLAGAITGLLVARVGSARVTIVCGLGYTLALVGVGLAPSWLALALTLLAMGAMDAVMDAAMNAHGVIVQRHYGRSILHGFHGLWSAGTLLGGATAALAAALGVPLPIHLALVASVFAALTLLASRGLLGGREIDVRHQDEADERGGPASALSPVRLARLLWPVALAGLLGVTLEDAAQTWSSVYLADVLATGAGVAAIGFVVYTAMMTLGRLTNDRWIDRWGNVTVARAGALLASAGLAVVATGGVSGSAPLVVLGFALVGIGASPIFPVMVDAAGHRPGVRSADGIATVSWTARFGFFVAPLLVGITADAVGLATAFVLPLAAGLGSAALASAFGRRDAAPPSPARTPAT